MDISQVTATPAPVDAIEASDTSEPRWHNGKVPPGWQAHIGAMTSARRAVDVTAIADEVGLAPSGADLHLALALAWDAGAAAATAAQAAGAGCEPGSGRRPRATSSSRRSR